MDETTREFLIESREGLDQIDLDLVALEQAPEDDECLGRVFRTLHSIKGMCGFLGFETLERVAHAGESLLGRLRDHECVLDSGMATALLALCDTIRKVLDHVEHNGQESNETHDDLIARFERLLHDAPEATEVESAPQSATIAAAVVTAPPVEAVLAATERTTPHATNSSPQHASPSASESVSAATPREPRTPVSDPTVRVHVDLLDRMINQVGELVFARNQIVAYAESHHDPALVATSQRLNAITTELQQGVMKTRMQAIGSTWNKFPRIVRDLASMLDKRVRIEMDGEETELDRTIGEAIKDPLTHIVRNSVDHGIELPDERVARGKPAEGLIKLRAYHASGQVIIEITDDGRGIDTDRVRDKAMRSGIISEHEAATMSEAEATALVFAPGFSTAQTVTNISGRGVGMDVVKTNIERIGGTVEIDSERGRGTRLRVRLPLTLAIVPALTITSASDHYAIPQASLDELVRVDGANLEGAIEYVHDVPVYRLRGTLLPIVWLNKTLQVESEVMAQQLRGEAPLDIAVVQAFGMRFGLVVDSINDSREIVVKPLGAVLQGIECYAGATILGDGRVALILDVNGIATLSGVFSERSQAACRQNAVVAADTESAGESMLLFSAGGRSRYAIPLDQVERLEEFAVHRLEYAGGRMVVQYRESILPLLDLRCMLEPTCSAFDPAQPVQAIVHRGGGDGHVGLVVESILDVVEQHTERVSRLARLGISGSSIIQGHVTEIVDVEQLVTMASQSGHAMAPGASR